MATSSDLGASHAWTRFRTAPPKASRAALTTAAAASATSCAGGSGLSGGCGCAGDIGTDEAQPSSAAAAAAGEALRLPRRRLDLRIRGERAAGSSAADERDSRDSGNAPDDAPSSPSPVAYAPNGDRNSEGSGGWQGRGRRLLLGL